MRAIVARRLRKQAYDMYVPGSSSQDYIEVTGSGFRMARFGKRVYEAFLKNVKRKHVDYVPRSQGQILCDPDTVRGIYRRLKKLYTRRESFEGVWK